MLNNGYQVIPWEAGSVITTDALNNIEHGIADVVLAQAQDPKNDETTYKNGSYNKIWVKTDEKNSFEIPTYEELLEAKEEIYATYPVRSITSNPISFSDGANNVPIKDLVISIEPQQSGSGDPSPTNIRTISGFSACLITVHGENLYDSTKNVTGHLDRSNGNVVESSSDTTQVTDYLEVNDEELLITGHIFTAHDTSGFETVNACIYDEDKVFVRSNPVLYSQSGNGVAGIPINDGEKYIRYTITSNNANNSNYKFYSSRSYTTNWFTTAGTVYGGTLDVTTGVLTVDRVMITIDGSDSSRLASFNTDSSNFNRVQSNIYMDIGIANIMFECCDRFKPIALDSNESKLYKIWNSASAPRMFFGLPKTITTLDEAKAWFAANPTHIVARIASPQIYTLDPIEVKTLLGANTIYTNANDMTITYRVDPILELKNTITADLKALAQRVEAWADTLQTYTDEVTGTVNVHYVDPIVSESNEL